MTEQKDVIILLDHVGAQEGQFSDSGLDTVSINDSQVIWDF